jgi:hypothetical protein
MVVGPDGLLRARRMTDALEALATQLTHTQATLEAFIEELQDSLASATPVAAAPEAGPSGVPTPTPGSASDRPAGAESSGESTVPARLPLGTPVRRPEPPAPADPSARFRPPSVLEDHVLRRSSGPEDGADR